jgi:hypothetical protein
VTEDNIRRLLACLGVHAGGPHGEWYRAPCPLAFHHHRSGTDHNPSFGVHIEPTGRSGYQCFSCQIRSRDLADLIVDIAFALKTPVHPPPPMNLQLAQEIINAESEIGYTGTEWLPHPSVQVLEEFPQWWLDSFPSVFRFPAAQAYLNGRGVTPSLWSDLELRFDSSRNMVACPFWNISGKLAGMRGRSIITGAYPHYDYSWNHYNNTKLVLYLENRIDWAKPVVVVEGEFDAMQVIQVYPNVVANLTATLSEPKLKTLELAIALIGFFDNDEAGERASAMMKTRFGFVYRAVTYPEGSAKDPGAMPLGQIQKMLGPFV